jgi:hypothetical protein
MRVVKRFEREGFAAVEGERWRQGRRTVQQGTFRPAFATARDDGICVGDGLHPE